MKAKFLCSTLLLALFMASTGFAYNVTLKTSAGVGIASVTVNYNNNGGGTWSNSTTDGSGVATIPGGNNYVRVNYNLSSTGWVNTGGADITFYTTAVTAEVRSCVTNNVVPGASFRFNPGTTLGGTWLTGATQELLAGPWYVAVDIRGHVRNAQNPTLPGNNSTAGQTLTVTFLTTRVTGGAGTFYIDPLHDGLDNFYRLGPFTSSSVIELLPGSYYFKNNSTSANYLNGTIVGPYGISGCSASVNTYTLTYAAGLNGTISGPTPQTVNSGGNGAQVTAVPDLNYHFVSWSDGVLTASRSDLNVTANISVTATFAINTYTLNYSAGAGGTIVGSASQTVNYNTNGTLVTATPNLGYHFVSWSDAYPTTARTDQNVTANVSATANFAINLYTVSFNSNGGSSVSPASVPYGSAVGPLSTPTKTGYTFGGWYTDDGTFGTPFTAASIVTGDITVYAKWTAIQYTITFNSNGGSAVTSITQDFGTTVNAPTDPTKSGYTFAGWYSDAGLTTAYTFPHAMGLSITIYAKWTAASQTLTFESNGGTTVTAITQDIGTSVSAPTDPIKSGYTFGGWYNEIGLTTPYTFPHTMGLSTTIYAKWTINTYTLNYAAGSGGTISGSASQTVGYNTNGTLVTATPNLGYHFVSWSDAYPTAARTDLNVMANVTATATFACTPPSITGQPEGQIVLASCSATFTAAASGTPAPTVQWQLSTNGGTTWGDIGGAINTTLSLPMVTLSQTGKKYRAVFTNSCGSSASNAATLTVQPSATLRVQFIVHALQDNTCRPKVRNLPVEGAKVRVYTLNDVCPNNLVISARPKIWGKIFDGPLGPSDPDPGCTPLTVGSYVAEGVTGPNGEVNIVVPPTTTNPNIDYVVIGSTTAFEDPRTVDDPDAMYSGKRIANIKAGETKTVKLRRLRLFSGKIVPASDLEEYGTYLAIVQPEYIDWSTDQEQYPFVLETEGDWSVTTSVETPEGFVPDFKKLSADVKDTVAAIQFTLTDVGSKWTTTVVKHKIKHKGANRDRQSNVPMFDKKKGKKSGPFKAGAGESETPTQYALYQCYPDPFNPTTNIQYDLPSAGLVTLKVYNTLGQEVAVLVDKFRDAGRYTATFDAGNLSSGVYFYRIQAGQFAAMNKMVLVK